MKPKEKAQELVDRYLNIENYNNLDLDLFCDECGMGVQAARYASLIAVDEILSVIWMNLDDEVDYWAKVKEEIEKIYIEYK